MINSQKGFAHILVLIAAIGLVSFLLVSSTGFFKNELFAKLYPKKSSFASGPITPASSRVFVTSTTYNGNLGGLAGADAKCQSRADAANLGGTWKAWLGDGTGSPSSRFIKSTNAYKRIDGQLIANNWNDLVDGNLQNPILVSEFGSNFNSQVWTNTKIDGTVKYTGNASCNNWTSNAANGLDFSTNGISSRNDFNWTDTSGSSLPCNSIIRLYCFEQPAGATTAPTQVPTAVPTAIPTKVPTPTPDPCKTAINPNQTVNGSLSETDCASTSRGSGSWKADKYTFSASEGSRVSVDLTSIYFDTHLYLLNPDGSRLAVDGDGGNGTNSRIPALPKGFIGSNNFNMTSTERITLPSTGTYTIEVTSFESNVTGNYTLTLTGP